jgi:hypothetical protein
MVCLQECHDDVVDCSCESARQSVYGPQISFLGHFSVRLLVLLLVVVWPVVFDMPIYDSFLDVYVLCMLHVLYI